MRRVALLTAIAMGGASMGLFARYKKNFEEQASGGQPVPVLVAASSIALGEILTEDDLAIRDIPESYVDQRHIRAADADKALGIRTTMGLQASEALLWTDLAVASDERRVLSGLVKTGMRAVSVRIERGASLGGLLRPGDRIDLLLRADRDGSPVVLPLLQNVLVLAVGGDLGASGNLIDMVQSASDLTLSVTIRQAQALTLAQDSGSLTASLRNPEDIVVDRNSPAITSEDIHLADRRARLQTRRADTAPARAGQSEIEHVR